jgi:hypothetical protein
MTDQAGVAHPRNPVAITDPTSIDFAGDPTTDPGHLHTSSSAPGGGGPFIMSVPLNLVVPAGLTSATYPGVTVRLATGETATLIGLDSQCVAGTGAEVWIRQNGVDIAGLTSVTVLPGPVAATPIDDVSVTSGDYFDVVLVIVCDADMMAITLSFLVTPGD